jgi:hypothetical protein
MLAVIATSATLALNAQAQDASPKGIYRDPATSATTNGIAYRIYAVHGDQKQEVSVRHNFYSADRFKLQLKLKDPAYVYVLNRTFNGEPKELGEKGITTVRDEDRRRQRDQPRYSVLFPAAGEHPVKIEGGRYRDIPGDVLLRMDDTPGLEKLYVIVSDHEIDLRRLYGNAIRFDHGSEDRPEAREGRRSDSEGDVLDRLNKDMSDWAANGQTEGPSGDDKGTSSKGIERDTYTVAPRNKTFMAEITLHHYRD